MFPFKPRKLNILEMHAPEDYMQAAIACENSYKLGGKYSWGQKFTREDALAGFAFYNKPPLKRIPLMVMPDVEFMGKHPEADPKNILAFCVSSMIPNGNAVRIMEEYVAMMSIKPINGMKPGEKFYRQVEELGNHLDNTEPYLLVGDTVKVEKSAPPSLYPLLGGTITHKDFTDINPKFGIALVKGDGILHNRLTRGGPLALAHDIARFDLDKPDVDGILPLEPQFITLLKISLTSLAFNGLREYYGYK